MIKQREPGPINPGLRPIADVLAWHEDMDRTLSAHSAACSALLDTLSTTHPAGPEHRAATAAAARLISEADAKLLRSVAGLSSIPPASESRCRLRIDRESADPGYRAAALALAPAFERADAVVAGGLMRHFGFTTGHQG